MQYKARVTLNKLSFIGLLCSSIFLSVLGLKDASAEENEIPAVEVSQSESDEKGKKNEKTLTAEEKAEKALEDECDD